jgi:hypothetical protein
MRLEEWLVKSRFVVGNPFGLKQADDEGDDLQLYFIEHPGYNAILDFSRPRSSVLYAPRGAGKSSARRMFEHYCSFKAQARILLVHLTDWAPIVDAAGAIPLITAQHHVRELLRQVVVALAQDSDGPLRTPDSDDLQGYLRYLCGAYGQYLEPEQRTSLVRRGWLGDPHAAGGERFTFETFTVQQTLRLVVKVIQSVGYTTCYVLIDRIDELIDTIADWRSGAALLAPLIGNLAYLEITGLAFKFFIPSEIAAILINQGILRRDRIKCAEIRWDGQEKQNLLHDMLKARLSHFSAGEILSLAKLAPDLPSVDEHLILSAAGSPRRLLNLGEWLFEVCAADATDDDLTITRAHLEKAQTLLAGWLAQEEPAEVVSAPAPVSAPPRASPAGAAEPEPDLASTVPLLLLKPDGSVWRGEQVIEGWQKMGRLQRRLLEYLYEHRGTLCYRDDTIDTVWALREKPSDEDSLRKLVDRLIHFIEPNPECPVYVHAVYGGYLRLDNCAP